MLNIITKIESQLVRIEGLILFIALCGLILMLAMQVFFRFVLQAPLAFTEETARLLFSWLIFVGAARALYVSQHFMVDIVYKYVPATLQSLFGYVCDVATLVFALVLVYAGVRFMASGQVLPVLGISVGYQSAALPVGMALLSLHALAFVLRGKHVGSPVASEEQE